MGCIRLVELMILFYLLFNISLKAPSLIINFHEQNSPIIYLTTLNEVIKNISLSQTLYHMYDFTQGGFLANHKTNLLLTSSLSLLGKKSEPP